MSTDTIDLSTPDAFDLMQDEPSEDEIAPVTEVATAVAEPVAEPAAEVPIKEMPTRAPIAHEWVSYVIEDAWHDKAERPLLVLQVWSNEMLNGIAFIDGYNDGGRRADGSAEVTRWVTSVSYGHNVGQWHF